MSQILVSKILFRRVGFLGDEQNKLTLRPLAKEVWVTSALVNELSSAVDRSAFDNIVTFDFLMYFLF